MVYGEPKKEEMGEGGKGESTDFLSTNRSDCCSLYGKRKK